MNIENIFYHLSPILLEKGSIILPGNWGRIINEYTIIRENENTFKSHDIHTIIIEVILEFIRKKKFQDKPSRLHSIFLFQDKSLAIKYKDGIFERNDVLYEVNILNEKNISKHDYTILNEMKIISFDCYKEILKINELIIIQTFSMWKFRYEFIYKDEEYPSDFSDFSYFGKSILKMISDITFLAIKYWQNIHNHNNYEILVSSPIKIVSKF